MLRRPLRCGLPWNGEHQKASYPKRALVVVTDGAVNHSRFTSSNLKDFARERNVQIFSIGAEGSINNVVDVTGGYAFRGSTRPFMGLDEVYRTIAVELKSEYVIGYRSTNTAKDGRWRQIRAKWMHLAAFQTSKSARSGAITPRRSEAKSACSDENEHFEATKIKRRREFYRVRRQCCCRRYKAKRSARVSTSPNPTGWRNSLQLCYRSLLFPVAQHGKLAETALTG